MLINDAFLRAETDIHLGDSVFFKINERKVTIMVFPLGMAAIILAFVGGLGLMGTMSTNVLERQREIGVMRAIGQQITAYRMFS